MASSITSTGVAQLRQICVLNVSLAVDLLQPTESKKLYKILCLLKTCDQKYKYYYALCVCFVLCRSRQSVPVDTPRRIS